MAISYTPEQYNTIKTVADKMGSGNENFKSAVNKKYGEGAYDSYLGYKAPPPTAGVNASASALTQTGSIPAPEVSPNGMQGLASSLVNKATSVPSNVVDNTGANTALVQTPEEKAWQLKQDAFNQANPVGTKTEDIQPSKAPTTPVTTPQATVAPTTTTTPVKTQTNAKQEPTIDFNSSVGREEQIGTNLTNITAQTPELLTDRTKYDKAFGYATADEGKKALLDSFFANGKKAMDNVNTIKQYAGASVDDLSASLLDGSISPSVKNILMSDPVMQAKLSKAEALNKVNDKKVNTTAVGEKQTLETLASSPTIANAMENGELSGEEVNALTSTPEQIALKKKRDIEFEDLNKKTAIWDSIEQDIDTKTYGKNITASDKAQMVANARKTLLPELNRAERAYNNTTAQLTELKKDALGLLETNLSLYKEKKASEAKVVADKVNFQQQKDIMDYQNKLSQANITTEKIVDPATGKTVLINSKTGDIVASYNTGLKSEAITPYEQAQIDIAKSKMAQPSWKQDADGNWYNENANISPARLNIPSSTVETSPSGTTQTYQIGNKMITLDSIAMPAMQKAFSEMENAGMSPLLGANQFRTKEQQAQLVKEGKSWTMDSKHLTGMAVDLYNGDVSKAPTAEQIAIMNKNGWYQDPALLSKDPGHFEYKGTEPSGTTSFTPSEEAAFTNFKGDSEDLGKEIRTSAKVAQEKYNSWKTTRQLTEDDQGILSAFLKDVSGTAVNEKEYARNEERYLGYKKQGLNQSEIKDKLAGYYPTDNNKNNQSVKNQLVELRNQAMGAGSKAMEKVATQVNSGNFKGAVNTIEQAKFNQSGIKPEAISDAGSYIQQGDKLIKRIDELSSKFGPIAGKLEKWGQFVQNDTQTQNLISQMTAFAAEYRNKIGGTALTGNEEEFLDTLIPTITNKPENAKEKVRTQLEVAFNKINNIRGQVDLPRLTSIEQTYNEDKRVNAFKGKAQPTQKQAGTDISSLADKYSK